MVTLGLIGAGRWGANYIQTLRRLSWCRLKYICDERAVALKPWQKDYVTTKRYTDLFDFPDLQGVIIATPAKTHFALAHDFLKLGYPVLVEKPLALKVSQAIKLKRLQQEQNLAAMVGHIYLYTPGYQKIKYACQRLGPLQQVEFIGLNSGLAPKQVSVLWEWGPHGVSMCSDLVNNRPVAVRAGWLSQKLNQSAQAVKIQLRFPNQVRALIKVGWGFRFKRRRVTLVGARGKFAINLGEGQPLKREVADFVKAISTGSKPKANFDNGLMVTQVLAKAAKSLKENGQEMFVSRTI